MSPPCIRTGGLKKKKKKRKEKEKKKKKKERKKRNNYTYTVMNNLLVKCLDTLFRKL